MPNRCFFIGHTDTPEDIFPGLDAAIERQIIKHGVTEFYVGNHGRFDILVYRALRAAKRRHPEICCYLVTAYHPGSGRIDPPDGLDGVFCPLERSFPPRFALQRANKTMIDQCDALIAAVRHPGRSRDLLDYALKREKRGLIQVKNLADENV